MYNESLKDIKNDEKEHKPIRNIFKMSRVLITPDEINKRNSKSIRNDTEIDSKNNSNDFSDLAQPESSDDSEIDVMDLLDGGQKKIKKL